MIPHRLTNSEIQKYYQNKPRFNEVYSTDNLPKQIKDGRYIINFDGYTDVCTHWISLYCRDIEIIYFDSLGVEHVPKESEKFIGYKNINTNIFKIQSNTSIMCEYFCIGLIDFIFSPYHFQKMTVYSWVILRMNKVSSIEEIDASNLSDQKKFRLNETNEIKDYFNSEIRERKAMNKKLSKYIAVFDYIDKTLIILSATSGGISIIFFASVIGALAGTASSSFTLVFSLKRGIIKRPYR